MSFQFCLFATTISPYKNLSHLQESSHSIYLATAIAEETNSNGNEMETFTIFQVKNTIKGSDHQTFKIKSASKKIGDVFLNVDGDMDFHLQETYLLFLKDRPDGTKSPICLSYYIFQEVTMNGIQMLVPSFKQDEFKLVNVDHKKIHYVYKKNELLKSLKEASVQNPINIEESVAPMNYQSMVHSSLKNAPGHCRYFEANNRRYRIENAESTSIPVYYQGDVGSGCSNIQTQMSNATNHLNANYQGINMSLMGTFTGYQPVCAENGGAGDISFFGGNYDTYINQQFPNANGRLVLVQFDDPCSELDPLDGCSGVLARGGTSALGTHQLNGETFNTALYGYVIVNEDTGTCHCNNFNFDANLSTYSLMIAHEITHAMGLRHVETQYGLANMNPSISSAITNLDVQCNADLYPAPKADLVVECVNKITVTNTSIRFNQIKVTNQGDAASPFTYLGYYLSTDQNITTDDILIGTDYVKSLEPGSVSYEYLTYDAAALNLQNGTYYIGTIADYRKTLEESDETNNVCRVVSPTLVIQAVVETCEDGIQNQDEEGVDCGGSCLPCASSCENITSEFVENFESFSRCTTSNACTLPCNLTNGWTNFGSDDIDWKVHSGTTTSSSTGPQSSTGNYLYTEATSCFNKEALLISPCFNLSNLTDPVCTFSANMYGSTMGTMDIGISVAGADVVYQTSISGNQGVDWFTVSINLPQTNNVRIFIKAKTGPSFRSDMAIDNFKISSSSGTNPGCVNGNNYREDFESNSVCSTSSSPCNRVCEIDNGWVNETNDDLDWRVNSGRTPSGNTGPSLDKRPGTISGKYLYTEASSSCRNSTAILTSPCFDLSSVYNPRLRFYYHMYGSNMGKLELGISTDGSSWTYQTIRNGELSDYWAGKTVSLPSASSVQIRFVGTTGPSFRSDMAIDDIFIYDEPDALPDVASTLKAKTNKNELDGFDELNMLISPNPANDQFKIHLENLESNQAIIEMYNTSGQRILQRNVSTKGNVSSTITAEINTSQFHPGMYFVRAISNDKRVNKKVLVKINSL